VRTEAKWPSYFSAFTPATWIGRHAVDTFPASPYRGERPQGSFVVQDGLVWGLDPCDGEWVDRETAKRVSLDGRSLVLAYGSNANPEKLSEHLAGTVVVLRCLVRNYAAVWCDARRREGSVVATIAPDPGWIEIQHVLAVTQHQLDLINRWEGHTLLYERQGMPDASVLVESGEMPSDVLVYVGTAEKRPPLLVDGAYWRTAEHSYAEVDALLRDREGSYK
jgi:hypothetical protein